MDKKEFIIKLPNKKGADAMKASGVFVFDSCSLLSIYSFTDKERAKFLSILKNLASQNRLWLPYQFLEEFEAHRLEKIQEQHEAYTRFKNIVDLQFKSIIENQSVNNFANHKFLKKFKEEYIADTKEFHKKVTESLQEAKAKHPDWRIVDPVKKALMKCFGEKIGNPYSEEDERYKEVISKGPERYSKFTPPGYMDSEKNRTDASKKKQFGDLIAWFQIMDYAKIQKNPIAVVTDDVKEDWWNKQDGKLFGPRIELMYEIHEYAGVHLEMFNMERFLEYANKELEISIEGTLLEKVKEIKGENTSQENVSAQSETNISQEPKLAQSISNEPLTKTLETSNGNVKII